MKTQSTGPQNRFTQQSPFHQGEKILQQRIGLSDKIEAMGRKVIRSFMPDQHRQFFAQLRYVAMGSVDEEGWPWATILTGDTGFMSSVTPDSLSVNVHVQKDNPVFRGIKSGKPVGMLGIDLSTRRRNRLNGRISEHRSDGFSLSVDQSMGNCPKYIQPRDIHRIRDLSEKIQNVRTLTSLNHQAHALIERADTFFVSSYVQQQNEPEVEGVDVSHRGGKPGFIRIEGNTLTIPDYSGNNVFMTLGNFLMVPKAGLVFVDFASGDLLMLTGYVEILWEDSPEVQAFEGAQRAWRFELDHGVFLERALPFSFQPEATSR